MKKQLVNVRRAYPEEPLLDVDHAGLNATLTEILELWKNSEPCPSVDTFIEKTLVKDEAGNDLGFNYYLVADEPLRLGKMRVEIE